MFVVLWIVVGLVLLRVLYPFIYRRQFNKAFKKHVRAQKEGKKPLLMVGAGWFKFYEHYDLTQLSKEVRDTIVFVGATAIDGTFVITYTRRFPMDL